MSISQTSFGTSTAGAAITKFICHNAHGYSMELIDYGATLVAFHAPDRMGISANITLGCPDMAAYEANQSYLGATVGRYCNRIAGAQFSIGDEVFSLAANNGANHLHGGPDGFAGKVWQTEVLKTDDSVGVRFFLRSPDGEGGYPGNLEVSVDYVLNNDNELIIEFRASTDKATHINLTNHSYWNLTRAGRGTIDRHILKLNSQRLVAVSDHGIPTGELKPVTGTVFDFGSAKPIGDGLKSTETTPVGYDHCYVVDPGPNALAPAAQVHDPASGRTMDVFTTQPGVQLYTANWMDGSPVSGGFEMHSAFALETQHFPDSPNHPTFPSTLLEPGEQFHEKTVIRFGVR